MSHLSIQQLLVDARRLSVRLRDHDGSADNVISSAQAVLKEVEGLKEYQEDVEQLNSIAHNRPRAQLVLGIQQENRHIRQLQHENKELRSALEESQNAVSLIMSKYREHTNHLVNTTKLDKNILNHHKSQLLQEKTEQIHEMASVMQKSIQLDDQVSAKEREVRTRLITENKGLREMLEISRANGSLQNPIIEPRLVSNGVQTDDSLLESLRSSSSFEDKNSPLSNKTNNNSKSNNTKNSQLLSNLKSDEDEDQPVSLHLQNGSSPSNVRPSSSLSSHTTTSSSTSPTTSVVSVFEFDSNLTNGGHLSEDSSDDDEVTFNTIQRKNDSKLISSCDTTTTKVNGINITSRNAPNGNNDFANLCNTMVESTITVVNGDTSRSDIVETTKTLQELNT